MRNEWEEIEDRLLMLSKTDVSAGPAPEIADRLRRHIQRLHEREAGQIERVEDQERQLRSQVDQKARQEELQHEITNINALLNHKDQELQSTLSEEDSEILRFRQQLDEKEKAFKVQEREIQEAKRQLKEGQLQKAQIETRAKVLRDENWDITERNRRQWEETADRTRRTQAELDSKSSNLGSRHSELGDLQRQLHARDQEIDDLRRNVESALSKTTAARAEIGGRGPAPGSRGAACAESSEELREKRRQAEHEFNSVHDANAELEGRLRGGEERLRCANIKKGQVMGELEGTHRQLGRLSVSSTASREAVSELQASLDAARARRAEAEANAKQASRELEDRSVGSCGGAQRELDQRVEQVKTELSQAMESRRSTTVELRGERRALEGQADGLRQRLGDLRRECAALEDEADGLEREAGPTSAPGRPLAVETGKEAAQRALAEATGAAEVADLQQRLQELERKEEGSMREIKATATRLAAAREQPGTQLNKTDTAQRLGELMLLLTKADPKSLGVDVLQQVESVCKDAGAGARAPETELPEEGRARDGEDPFHMRDGDRSYTRRRDEPPESSYGGAGGSSYARDAAYRSPTAAATEVSGSAPSRPMDLAQVDRAWARGSPASVASASVASWDAPGDRYADAGRGGLACQGYAPQGSEYSSYRPRQELSQTLGTEYGRSQALGSEYGRSEYAPSGAAELSQTQAFRRNLAPPKGLLAGCEEVERLKSHQRSPSPGAGLRQASPGAVVRVASPGAGLRQASPSAGLRHASPGAGLRTASPQRYLAQVPGGHAHQSLMSTVPIPTQMAVRRVASPTASPRNAVVAGPASLQHSSLFVVGGRA